MSCIDLYYYLLLGIASLTTVFDARDIYLCHSLLLYVALASNIPVKSLVFLYKGPCSLFFACIYEVCFLFLSINMTVSLNKCDSLFVSVRPVINIANISLIYIILISERPRNNIRIHVVNEIIIELNDDSDYEIVEIQDWECPVCLGNEGIPISLPCNHLVHEECIIQWANSNSRNSHLCPLCRYPFITSHSSSL